YFVFADKIDSPVVGSNLIGLATYRGIADIGFLVPSSGKIDDATMSRQFVFQKRAVNPFSEKMANLAGVVPILNGSGTGVIHLPSVPQPAFRCTFLWSEIGLVFGSVNAITPSVAGPFDIRDELTSDALQSRRRQIERDMVANRGLPASLMTYLEEAYYFVPM